MAAGMSQSEIKQVENIVAEHIAALEPTRPDIIRAAPASAAVACCAKPLRGFGGRSFFHYSKPISRNTRIKEFWSHSWHGPRWMVVMTVLLLNNSLAALVISTLVSFLLGLFYAMDRLPPLEGFIEFNGLASGWSQWGGMVSYILTLFFWPSRKKIFLDLLCIDQTNESEKQDALLSMGAFLKRSESLIVFWDPTYTRRLWCVFELAAYLHTHGGGLIILPTIAGPCFLCVTFSLGVFFILIGFVGDQDIQLFRAAVGVIACFCFYLTVSTFRKYFHSVKVCARELKHFQLHRTVCFCCMVGHLFSQWGAHVVWQANLAHMHQQMVWINCKFWITSSKRSRREFVISTWKTCKLQTCCDGDDSFVMEYNGYLLCKDPIPSDGYWSQMACRAPYTSCWNFGVDSGPCVVVGRGPFPFVLGGENGTCLSQTPILTNFGLFVEHMHCCWHCRNFGRHFTGRNVFLGFMALHWSLHLRSC